MNYKMKGIPGKGMPFLMSIKNSQYFKHVIILVGIAVIICLILFGVLFALLINQEPTRSDVCDGQKISFSLDSVNLQRSMKIPGGYLVFANRNSDSVSSDTLPPVLAKLNRKEEVIWAVFLDSKIDSCGQLPFYKAIDIRLVEEKNGDRMIYFFNTPVQEPGWIYLTRNYDFAGFYLDAM